MQTRGKVTTAGCTSNFTANQYVHCTAKSFISITNLFVQNSSVEPTIDKNLNKFTMYETQKGKNLQCTKYRKVKVINMYIFY